MYKKRDNCVIKTHKKPAINTHKNKVSKRKRKLIIIIKN